MTALRYSFSWLPAVDVFGVLGTIGVWFFAFVWLVVVLVAALGAVVAAAWGPRSALAEHREPETGPSCPAG